MTAAEIKVNFLKWLPADADKKLQPIHYAMIDELVEHCLSGKSLFNDRPPVTEQEYNVMIGYGLVSLIPTFDKFITGVRESFPGEEVDIVVNYRDQQFKLSPKQNLLKE